MVETIAILSSSRADINYLTIPYLALDSAEFIVEFWATGQHFSKKHGYTIKNLRQRFPQIFEIPFEYQDIFQESMALGIANATIAMHQFLKFHKHPDFVILLGDRYEILGSAIAINDFNIPIIHLAGGDVSLGAKDEIYRFCISKLSQYHCPTNNEAVHNLRKMGIKSENIRKIGSTSFDYILSLPKIPKEKLYKQFHINQSKDIMLLTLHSETTQPDLSESQAKILRNAIEKFPQFHVICTGANMNKGGQAIKKIMAVEHENWHYTENLDHDNYLNLLKIAKICIGNSSSGIYEAPFCQVPSVNVGIRQLGRLCPPSVIHCNFDAQEITKAIQDALGLNSELFNDNLFGKGMASQKLINFIQDICA